MFPDFPSYKLKIKNTILNSVYSIMHNDPFKSAIRREILFEGRGFSHFNTKGEKIRKDLSKIESKVSISDDEIISGGILVFLDKMVSGAEKMSVQSTKLILDEIDESTSEVGNNLSCDNENLDEMIYEAIKKIHIDFDEDGNPYMPTMYMSPQVFEKIKHLANKNEELSDKMKQILKTKKEEYDVRESNRKLVD